GRPVVFPIEMAGGDYTLGDSRSVVFGIGLQILIWIPKWVAEYRRIPVDLVGESLRVRIDQQFGGIEALTRFRRIRSLHAVPVMLSELDSGDVAVPDVSSSFTNGDHPSRHGTRLIEQAQVDAR